MAWIRTKILATAVAWACASAAPINTATSPADSSARVGGCTLPEFWVHASGLSDHSEIYFPGSGSQFTQYSQRWSILETPTPSITFLPANDNDVAEIVKVANKCKVPFLAYNGVHGAITTLGRMESGIAVNLKKLSSVSIAANGKTATIAGGTNSKVVIDKLWAAGKQAVTGTCECVSYMGPALGGGHGWLQGRYGLIADQFVSLKVVLADGTLKTVSPTENGDLWWAMNGAGHNFGIVTSVTIKIYPRVHTNWAIETFMFTGDKVKALYQAANDHILKNGAQPVDIINWSYWMNIPQVDPNGPVIECYVIQEGVTTVNPAYTKPFRALGPLSVTPKTGSYLDVSAWVGISLDGPPCQKTGAANPRFPLYLGQYNATAMQETYNLFKSSTTASSPFANSLFMFEGYSMQGVKAADAGSAAFAWREDNLLTAPLIQYRPARPTRDKEAARLGNQLRQILHRGSGRAQMNTYVNYAYGNDSPREWYGHEVWRQARLETLKRKYNPEGRFSFYAPVA